MMSTDRTHAHDKPFSRRNAPHLAFIAAPFVLLAFTAAAASLMAQGSIDNMPQAAPKTGTTLTPSPD